jgi:hypothetical protein
MIIGTNCQLNFWRDQEQFCKTGFRSELSSSSIDFRYHRGFMPKPCSPTVFGELTLMTMQSATWEHFQ